MATVTPSQVSASDVNTEMGVSSSLQLLASNNSVRNVAAVPSGTSQINFGKLRWGINFPGRFLTQGIGAVNRPNYPNANNISVTTFTTVTAPTGFANANSIIDITSGGTISYIGTSQTSSGMTPSTYSKTWLTSGTNADYTANVVVSSGSFDSISSQTNTDLALSSNRRWRKSVHRATNGSTTESVSGVIIIKNDGVEIFRRPFTLGASATFNQF